MKILWWPTEGACKGYMSFSVETIKWGWHTHCCLFASQHVEGSCTTTTENIYLSLAVWNLHNDGYSSNRWAHTLLSKPVFQELKKPKWSTSVLANASYVHMENVCMALACPPSWVLQCLFVDKLIQEDFCILPFLAMEFQDTSKTNSPTLPGVG